MIAQRYGQPPHLVAEWAPEWLAACSTVMQAEAGAQQEISKRDARRSKLGRR